ncbi:hypothetical protein H9W90_11940 [Polaribacter pectinis]|uniref:Ppx/GppA phosphatase N-terminal domain-containing protein n=1 Tax=Polaribacter pectinis TaxID=2738844 RepID=A0A7G9L8E8_9FLAO|nr:hypothetical protein [Polaribacter pectinis]QNM84897.1 hypothetical protein H9W90_11940 [Polaribacter pectinis]
MDIQYSRDRYIVILELSSTAIKILKLQPKIIDKKLNRHEINRYKSFTIGAVIKKYIENNTLNIDLYKKHILPIIIKELNSITRLQPQAIRILATGYYRSVTNTNSLLKVIENSFPKYVKDKGIVLEILTPDEESYLSYLSWEKTYLFKENVLNENNLKLNIDVGGGSTEITLFNKPPFKNTISLEVGVDYYMNDILTIEYLDSTTIWYHLIEAKKNIKHHLNEKIIIPNEKIKFAICTGSTLILDREDEINNQILTFNTALGNTIFSTEKELSERIEWKGRKQININNNERKIFRKLFGLIILNEILKHFNVDYSYNNLANLRIGAYHQTKEYLMQLHGYKI